MKNLTFERYNRIIEYKSRQINKAISKKQYQYALICMNEIRKLNHELWLCGCLGYSEMKEYNKKAGASNKRLYNTERRMYDAVISNGTNQDNNGKEGNQQD